MSAAWELFPHGSDVGVRGIGPTEAEAFEQAAMALTGVIYVLGAFFFSRLGPFCHCRRRS